MWCSPARTPRQEGPGTSYNTLQTQISPTNCPLKILNCRFANLSRRLDWNSSLSLCFPRLGRNPSSQYCLFARLKFQLASKHWSESLGKPTPPTKGYRSQTRPDSYGSPRQTPQTHHPWPFLKGPSWQSQTGRVGILLSPRSGGPPITDSAGEHTYVQRRRTRGPRELFRVPSNNHSETVGAFERVHEVEQCGVDLFYELAMVF